MKIKCTCIFKHRKFTAESDDDLQNMTEVEAVADIFSAIGYTTEDIYAMEPKESEIRKHIKWKVEYGDILVMSSENIRNDDLAWSDRIRYVVYSIIKAEYKYRQTGNELRLALQKQPYEYQMHQYLNTYNPGATLSIPLQVVPPCPVSFVDNMILMRQILDPNTFEEYKKMRFRSKKLNDIFYELKNLEKYRELCNKMKGGGKEKTDDAH